MKPDFDGVQRIVLRGTRWRAAGHLMLAFGKTSPLPFLNELLSNHRPTAADRPRPEVQFSLGFTRCGLKQAQVPEHVLSCFALKSPAFWAGAAQRAASHLGLTDANAPELWKSAFDPTTLHAVLSVHATSQAAFGTAFEAMKARARHHGIESSALEMATALPPPVELSPADRTPGQWVHFGFRDGLSRVFIEGWTSHDQAQQCLPTSHHKAGEFVLGHPPDRGADPWVAGPGQRIWPDKLRAFFRNGSFGVLQQIQQDVGAFETFVQKASEDHPAFDIRQIKGKLCGRLPEGQPLAAPDLPSPADDFDYAADPDGELCPFGSHIRRMNPRVPPQHSPTEQELARYPAHFSLPRPLLRRGMPYGTPWRKDDGADSARGLIGQFFCASIENQFEHLLGQWADRVPLGSPDEGGARDPLIGAHETGDGAFEIRRRGSTPLRLRPLTSFTRTLGAAYLFYPSLAVLHGIAENGLWGLDDKGDDA